MEDYIAPFWGHQTSYLNFCEEVTAATPLFQREGKMKLTNMYSQDYVVTRYIAEFINTLSSLTFLAYGIYGLAHGRRAGARLVAHCGLIGVGVCSAGYHMTLKYHTQMSDELSMHLLTTPLVYRLLTFNASPQRTKLVGLVLMVLFTTVMVTHMVMDEFLLHAATFGLAVYIIASRLLKIIPQQALDPHIRTTLRNATILGCLFFAFGYFVWLIDEWACNMLIHARHAVGLPVGFLLELHGWWHVFTAIGGYIGVTVVDLLTSGVVDKDPTDRFAWPVPWAMKLMSRSAKLPTRTRTD